MLLCDSNNFYVNFLKNTYNKTKYCVQHNVRTYQIKNVKMCDELSETIHTTFYIICKGSEIKVNLQSIPDD